MKLEEANVILGDIETSASGDVELRRLLRQLLLCAVKYAHIRAEWALMQIDERTAQDSGRTSAHNAFIDSCNILSRAMQAKELDNSWRRKIGEERKDIGDFASLLHAVLSIRSR